MQQLSCLFLDVVVVVVSVDIDVGANTREMPGMKRLSSSWLERCRSLLSLHPVPERLFVSVARRRMLALQTAGDLQALVEAVADPV